MCAAPFGRGSAGKACRLTGSPRAAILGARGDRVRRRHHRRGARARVARPRTLTLDELKARPARTLAVTLECAGNGRSLLSPRPLSQPWVQEAVGTAEWTGTPLGPLLAEAGLDPEATEVVL